MLEPQRYRTIVGVSGMIGSPNGEFIKYDEAEYFIGVTICAMGYLNAESNLAKCTEEFEAASAAINTAETPGYGRYHRAKQKLEEAEELLNETERLLNTALALAGDKAAAERLGLPVKEEGESDA